MNTLNRNPSLGRVDRHDVADLRLHTQTSPGEVSPHHTTYSRLEQIGVGGSPELDHVLDGDAAYRCGGQHVKRALSQGQAHSFRREEQHGLLRIALVLGQ